MAIKDLTNQRFGKLVVLKRTTKPVDRKTPGVYWATKCDCGQVKVIASSCLVHSGVKSCGCSRHADLKGKRFTNGVVTKLAGKNKRNEIIWSLRCKCGRHYKSTTQNLRSLNTRSCGCIREGKQSLNYRGFNDITGDFWSSIRRNAITRNLTFDITIEDAWNKFIKQNGLCALTRWIITLSSKSRRIEKQTASLDRINSLEGYHVDNIQWVHTHINKMKQEFSQDYFLKLCKAVINAKSIS